MKNKKIIIGVLIIFIVGAITLVAACSNTKKTNEITAESLSKVTKTTEKPAIEKQMEEHTKTEEITKEALPTHEKTEVVDNNEASSQEADTPSGTTVTQTTSDDNSVNSSSTNTTTSSKNNVVTDNNSKNTAKNNSSSNNSSNTKKEEEPKHEHNYNIPIYKTIHHDAEYKTIHHDAEYTTQTVMKDSSEVDYYMCKCYSCGAEFTCPTHSDAGFWNHIYEECEKTYGAGWYNGLVGTVEYDDMVDAVYLKHCSQGTLYAVYKQYPVEEQVLVKDAYDEQVVVKEAYDEKIVDHYECSCGAKK